MVTPDNNNKANLSKCLVFKWLHLSDFVANVNNLWFCLVAKAEQDMTCIVSEWNKTNPRMWIVGSCLFFVFICPLFLGLFLSSYVSGLTTYIVILSIPYIWRTPVRSPFRVSVSHRVILFVKKIGVGTNVVWWECQTLGRFGFFCRNRCWYKRSVIRVPDVAQCDAFPTKDAGQARRHGV